MYDIELRDDGWAVIDIDTGAVVILCERVQSGLSFDDADDLADGLNLIASQKPPQLS